MAFLSCDRKKSYKFNNYVLYPLFIGNMIFMKENKERIRATRFPG